MEKFVKKEISKYIKHNVIDEDVNVRDFDEEIIQTKNNFISVTGCVNVQYIPGQNIPKEYQYYIVVDLVAELLDVDGNKLEEFHINSLTEINN